MPKFLIERELPGAGNLSAEDLRGVSAKSCDALRELGPDVQWVESYITDDKITCIYLAPDQEAILEHARLGGFPATRVMQVRSVIDPTMADAAA